MEFIVLAVVLGLIPAMIARSKGREFLTWWIYGALLFIVALPHALLLKPELQHLEEQQRTQGLRKCPFCAEMIKPDARVCRYCGRDLPPERAHLGAPAASLVPEPPPPAGPTSAPDPPSPAEGVPRAVRYKKPPWEK
jgi:hypothetical protein